MRGAEQGNAGSAPGIAPTVERRRSDLARSASLALLAAIAACGVYLNSVGGDFVWDDRQLIIDDHAIKSWSSLGDILSHDFFDRCEDDLPYGYYRPVCTLTYLSDFSLWGLRPYGYHLTNVLLHAANSFMVVSILLWLGWGRLASLLAGLLFAVHPIHTENVAWIAGRTDLLAFFFCALALLLHLAAARHGGDDGHGPRRRVLLALAAFAFALGILAKEMGVVLIGWIVAIHAIAYRNRWREVFRASVPYLAVLVGVAAWRFAIIDISLPGVPAEHSFGAVVLTAAPTIARYLGWMVLPLDQSAYVQNPYVDSLSDARLWAAIAMLGALAVLYRLCARRSRRACLAAAMLAIAFVPILNIVRVAGPADMGAVMAERFLYFPSFPFLALVGLGMAAALENAVRGPVVRWALIAVPVGLLSFATVSRNRVWRDELTFLTATLRDSPNASLLWGNLANYHLRTGNLEEAAAAIDRAAEGDPESYAVLSSRALWYVMSDRRSEAIPLQETIVRKAGRGRVAALNNLAYLYRTTGREEDAREILERLVREGHGYADVQFNLAEIYRARGEIEQARSAYRLALDDRPQSLHIATALAELEMEQGRPEEAERIYRRMLRSYPNDVRLLNNVALTRYKSGDTAGALSLLRRVIDERPDYVRARINYAQLLQAAGRSSEAIEQMQTAVGLAAGSELEQLATEQLGAMRDGRGSAARAGGASQERR
jgi:tetratricopeptide (TPR) repeat protein